MSVSGTKDKKSDPPKPKPKSESKPKGKSKPEAKKPDAPSSPHASDQFEKKNTPKNAPQLQPPSGQGGQDPQGSPLKITVSQGQPVASNTQPQVQPQQISSTQVPGNTVVAAPSGLPVVQTPPTPQAPVSPSQLAEQFGLPDPAQPPPVGPVKPEGPPVCVAEPPVVKAPEGPSIGPASPEAVQQLQDQALAAAGKVPPIPSSTGTVVVTGNTMTDAQKIAAGAIQIDPKAPATTYDGMYVGSDGYAYPPDKFQPSQVPPFVPQNPVSSPTPTTYFVNGIQTQPGVPMDASQQLANGTQMQPGGAMGASQQLANRTGTNVVLVYNATEGFAQDVAQTGLDRMGQGNNPATQTLTNAINHDLAAGLNVNVVGYSQGGAIVSSALRDVDPAQLGKINVTGIASAGQTWPAGPQYTFYVNQYDVVPNMLGVHQNPVWDGISAATGLLNPVLPSLSGLGSTAPGANVYLISDPATAPSDPISPHYLDTYFQHIPER